MPPKPKTSAGRPFWLPATPLKIVRVAVDEPNEAEGESGTIYEYRIEDAHGDLMGVTYDADYAAAQVNAINSHAALVEALRLAREVVEDADNLAKEYGERNQAYMALKAIDNALTLTQEAPR